MSDYNEKSTSHPTLRSILLGILFSITLAISLFAAGFAVCTLPTTTPALSRLFSDFETSVYLPDDTIELASATRDFTVGFHGTSDSSATNVLAMRIMDAAKNSSAKESIKAEKWKKVSIPTTGTATVQMYELAAQGNQYSLGENEIKHLIDCNKIIRVAVPVLIVIAVITLISGVILGVTSKKRALGRALIAAPALLLLAMISIGVWAIVDFNAFFSAFHGLFFPQGNWTFPADSLLICMLPTGFWIAMAAIWIIVTIALSLVCILFGRHLLRR
ncbi:MAG: DUF1461 domain-containing protein [Eggerthellaceae bacterium]|nr:DUF1461 domain-containing protein [Eggerthellaceae bacterium]